MSLTDQTDLYAALKASGIPPEGLEALLAASDPSVQKRLQPIDAQLLRAIMRAGLGQEAIPGASAVINALRTLPVQPILRPDPALGDTILLRADGSDPDMPAYSDRAFDPWFAAKGKAWGLGRYGEERTVYQSAQFADSASPERRTIHMGIDVFAPAMTPLYAPLDARVHMISYNADPLDYGHTLILSHEVAGQTIFTLYGHLAGTLPKLLQVGQKVSAGQHIADFGDWHENGGWAPHVHFQIMTDMLNQSVNFFGVAHASLWQDVWQVICPDPNLILRIPQQAFA